MRASVLLLFFLAAMPHATQAIQLRWSTGTTNISVSTARRCTLMVSTGASEPLPSQWELQWVARTADSRSLRISAENTTVADTARVLSYTSPGSLVEKLANQAGANLDYSGSTTPHVARYLVDVPSDVVATLRLVAYHSTGRSSFVILRSPEATLNSGLTGAYPPALLDMTSTHSGTSLELHVAGSGLTAIQSAQLAAADTAWTLPLTLGTQTDTTLVLSATMSARLPTCQLVVSTGTRAASLTVSGESMMDPLVNQTGRYAEIQTGYAPKDFAFFYDGSGHFHLFYIRRNRNQSDPTKDEKALGHVWSSDLTNWTASTNGSVLEDSTSFEVGLTGSWDAGHVWAPTIVTQGPYYYMFYTGVDASGNERIGYARTQNILTPTISWERQSSATFTANNTNWAALTGNSTWGAGQHFRDPFVVEDIHNPGHYLMFYTAVVRHDSTHMSVGLAKSVGTSLTSWQDVGPLYMTDINHTSDNKVESPHAFLHINTHTHGAFGDSTWYLLFSEDSHGPNNTIHMWTHADSLMSNIVDTTQTFTQAGWNSLSFLQSSATDHSTDGWHGSEYLQVAHNEYLAGYNWSDTTSKQDSSAIWIRQIQWAAGTNQDGFSVSSASAAGVSLSPTANEAILWLASRNPGYGGMSLALQLAVATRVRLDILDVSGRRVRTIANGPFSAGRAVLRWDGRDGTGGRVGSGVFFARLSMGGETQSARFVLLH